MTYRPGGAGTHRTSSQARSPRRRWDASAASLRGTRPPEHSGRPHAGAHHACGHALGVRDRSRCPVPGGDIREIRAPRTETLRRRRGLYAFRKHSASAPPPLRHLGNTGTVFVVSTGMTNITAAAEEREPTVSKLLLVPLDDIVVFPNMNVTLTIDVGDEERVLLVPSTRANTPRSAPSPRSPTRSGCRAAAPPWR